MKKVRNQNNHATYQSLEPRNLLAGDVTATVDNGLLQIVGDAEGNEIIVAGRADGTATVFALGDTTINGSSDPFVVLTSLEDVDIQLNQGDDNATIQGLVLSKSLRVRTNAGADTTFIHHIDVQRFEQFSGDGNDTLEFNNVYSRGSISIFGENNDDIVSITNMAAGRNLTLDTGNGVDTVAIDNLGVKNRIDLNTGDANDQVIMTGRVYGYRANLLLGQGDDALNIVPATSGETALFFRRLNIQGGDGNDLISTDASVTSRRRTVINGGTGTDSFEQTDASLRNDSISSIENDQLEDLEALLDSVYASLTAANIDTTPFGQTAVVETVEPSITATTANLVYNETDGASAIDDGLLLVGDDATFDGASVSLGDTFLSDQDVLAFDDNSTTDSISGTFDATTGTITLTGSATAEEYQAALRAIAYNNTSDDPDESTRTVSISVSIDDGDNLTATRGITVVALDTDVAPVISRTSSTVDVNLDDQPTLPIPIGTEELTVSDSDSLQLSGAVVVIEEGIVAGDLLEFTAVDGITGVYEGGVLTFTGDADVDDYQTVLRNVTFNSTATLTAGQRRITFEATDTEGTTSTAYEVLINAFTDSSVLLQTSENVLPFFTEAGAPINVDSGINILATEGATVDEALVAISSGFAIGDDFLSFDRNLATENNITGFYDSATGELTFSGTGSIDIYQRLLRTVTYHSIDQALADSETRVVQFAIISDAEFAVTRTVTVAPRTEAQRAESIAERDERLIQDYIAAEGLTTQTTPSGLHYIVETEGNGQLPSETDNIVATYTGNYLNGVKFDNGTDIPFNLSSVIEGWTEGFQFFSPGGTGQLLFPSALAYGATGTNGGAGIPPNTVLQFDIEFVSNETQG